MGLRPYICAVFGCCLLTSTATAQDAFSGGVQSAAQNYGLGQLVNQAKAADPTSGVPSAIEHMLLGVSLATGGPQSAALNVMEAVYPGSLAGNAIGQLIDRHGEDIARMSYSDQKVFVGGLYSDPSIIPRRNSLPQREAAAALCTDMINGTDVGYCTTLARRIQLCNTSKNMSGRAVKNCTIDLMTFYELMEYEGKSALVRRAGDVAVTEMIASLIRKLEAKIEEAKLYQDMTRAKAASDRPRSCKQYNDEARDLRQSLLDLKRQYDGRADAEYSQQNTDLREQFRIARRSHDDCFLQIIRDHPRLSDAGVTSLHSFRDAADVLNPKYAGKSIDQIISNLKDEIKALR